MARAAAAIGVGRVLAPEIGLDLCPSWSYERSAAMV